MKRTLLLLAVMIWSITSAYAQPMGWDGIEKVFGRKGMVQGEMFKIAFPRSDLSVKIAEVSVEPGLALTSWIGFMRTGMENDCMMMGDLALLENEVAPVTKKMIAEDIQLTAIHNHLIGSTPFIMYLHFSGKGNLEKLAGAMRSTISLTGTPMIAPILVETAATPPDWAKVETIFGKTGQKKGNLLQMSFSREEKITENGMVVPPYMGMAIGINLQMIGNNAATTGDFVLIGSEVNPVIKVLVAHGITVTAIHSHMLFETPRLFFLHFWGYDEPEKLATGLKAALTMINLAK